MPLNPVPNYPASLDSLPDPTATIWMDDDGFEQDLILQKHNAILELLEAKVGIGSSVPGGSAAVLRRTASGASAWGQIAAGDHASGSIATADLAANTVAERRLAVRLNTDYYPGTAYTAGTFVDIAVDQAFTVGLAGSVVEIAFGGSIGFVPSVAGWCLIYYMVDSSGSPQAQQSISVGGCPLSSNTLSYNPLQGLPSIHITNLVAGTHTVKVQFWSGVAGTLYARYGTQNIELLHGHVTEYKR
jgi:hypothetical protein